jgi:hypothetical protein
MKESTTSRRNAFNAQPVSRKPSPRSLDRTLLARPRHNAAKPGVRAECVSRTSCSAPSRLAAVFSAARAPRNPKKPVFDFRPTFVTLRPCKDPLTGLRLRANAREGQKPFPISKQNFVEMTIKAAMGCPIAKNGCSPHELDQKRLLFPHSAPKR